MVESASRSRAPINSVVAFCNESGFRSRRNLSKVSSVWVFESNKSYYGCAHLLFSVFPIVLNGPSQSHPSFIMSLNVVAIDLEEMKRSISCVLYFMRNPLLMRNFSF